MVRRKSVNSRRKKRKQRRYKGGMARTMRAVGTPFQGSKSSALKGLFKRGAVDKGIEANLTKKSNGT